MSSVVNIERFIIPNDVIVGLTKIYEQIGKNEMYSKTIETDIERVIEQTVERDTFFLALILGLDLSDTRMRLIITKSSQYRTKEESVVYYLKELLLTIQNKHHSMKFQSNEVYNMLNFVYSQYNPIKFGYEQRKSLLQSQKQVSKRLLLDEITESYEKHLNKESYEKITLLTHYFLDFYNIAPFEDKNLTITYIMLYLLVLKNNLYAFKYVSFFEVLYNNLDEFKLQLANASYQWKEGYPQVVGLIKVIDKILLEGYMKTEKVMNEYEYDQNISKADNIEQTILKLPDIFTKDEIRLKHPYVSESTINRALIKLRDENLIQPLGKGRSAKWIKVSQSKY